MVQHFCHRPPIWRRPLVAPPWRNLFNGIT
jgi:hypothetical protein